MERETNSDDNGKSGDPDPEKREPCNMVKPARSVPDIEDCIASIEIEKQKEIYLQRYLVQKLKDTMF